MPIPTPTPFSHDIISSGKTCNTKLTLKIVQNAGGEVYCESHKPDRFAKNA